MEDSSYYNYSLDECQESGEHLEDCDEDGYCNLCGYQDSEE